MIKGHSELGSDPPKRVGPGKGSPTKSYVKLFIKKIHGISRPTQAHLHVTQINFSIFYFIGIVKLIMCLEYLKTGFKLKF